MNLPMNYVTRMKELLKDEYEAYESSFKNPHYTGLRVNELKISPEEFKKRSPYSLEPIPWTKNGFYYDSKEQPARHPYYYAGLYYIQEPSAMTPAAILPIEEGDAVLDLCAAPGGKSTELAAKLRGTGVLVSNDISNSRAKALLKNIEMAGVRNTVVTTEPPEKLARFFEGYFDKILIDAPCSGEGMFRKDPAMVKSYETNGVEFYAAIQKEIILTAATMLKPGGMMVYSTCTFAPEENEATIVALLEEFPDFHVVKPDVSYEGFGAGRPEWVDGPEELREAIRLWPQKIKGEGHFAVLLKRDAGEVKKKKEQSYKQLKLSDECVSFLKKVKIKGLMNRLELREDRLYAHPEGLPNLKGVRMLRTGLLLGELKKNRFEPSQALASALTMEEFEDCIDLKSDDPLVIKYLKGETIEIENSKGKGYQLVCVDGFPLGWGKLSQGTLKNKYCPGWRWM